MTPKRHRGVCSVVILILLAVIIGGWFFMQRRDFERKTSPAFLDQLKNVSVTLSEAKETRSDGKTQIYVTLKNGSGRIFDGKIILYSREINGVILDRTSLAIMPVSNGGSVTMVAWLRKSSIRPDFQYKLDVNFK